MTRASSCARWLGANPPNLERAQCALERIVKDGGRASAVVDRILVAIKREPIRVQQIISMRWCARWSR